MPKVNRALVAIPAATSGRPERRSTVLSGRPQASVYLDHNLGYATPIAALLICRIDTCPLTLLFYLCASVSLASHDTGEICIIFRSYYPEGISRFTAHGDLAIGSLATCERPHQKFTSRRARETSPVISASNDLVNSRTRPILRFSLNSFRFNELSRTMMRQLRL